MGGMLYLMELSTRWRPELTWRAFFACAATAYSLALYTASQKCVQVCVLLPHCPLSTADRCARCWPLTR